MDPIDRAIYFIAREIARSLDKKIHEITDTDEFQDFKDSTIKDIKRKIKKGKERIKHGK